MTRNSLSKIVFFMAVLAPLMAFGQDAAATAAVSDTAAKYDMNAWIALAAGFAMAIATFGGAMGQGRAASAALEGIARNPGSQDKVFVPMIISLALIESLVLLTFVVAFLLFGKIN